MAEDLNEFGEVEADVMLAGIVEVARNIGISQRFGRDLESQLENRLQLARMVGISDERIETARRSGLIESTL
jgi:hypothetical protein